MQVRPGAEGDLGPSPTSTTTTSARRPSVDIEPFAVDPSLLKSAARGCSPTQKTARTACWLPRRWPAGGFLVLPLRFGFQHLRTCREVGRKFGHYWDGAWYEKPSGVDG